MKKTILIIALTLTCCCACVGMNPYVQNTQKMAQESLEKMKRVNPSESSSALGINIDKDRLILAMDSNAEKYGFKLGDKIIAVNNQEVNNQEDVVRLMRMTKVGDDITLRILRNYSSLDIPAKTVDGKREQELFINTVEAMRDGNWKLCIEDARSLINTKEISQNYGLLYNCVACERITARRRPDVYEARILYDNWRLAIKEASINPRGLDSIRSGVIQNIDWLNNNGFSSFGSDLQRLLDGAERPNQTQNTSTNSTNANAPKKVESPPLDLFSPF